MMSPHENHTNNNTKKEESGEMRVNVTKKGIPARFFSARKMMTQQPATGGAQRENTTAAAETHDKNDPDISNQTMSDDASMSCVSCTSFFANEEVESTVYNDRLYDKATTMKKPDCQVPEHLKHNDLLRQIVASTIGTVVSVISLNPISVMKIMIQREDSLAVTSLQGAYRTILTTQGIRGFWAGASTGNVFTI